jgi:hypothetical protein
MEYPVS